MANAVSSYDGSIVSTPQQLVRPESVEELQNILKQRDRYPSPVRAMGSFHSLTPCAASPGTIVDMKGLDKVVSIDAKTMTFTAQAGLQMIDAADALRELNLQFMLNIEIGNMTLGSAACCHTKDSLDGVELGQVNSYVIGVKWVSPSGTLEEASEERNPDLLPFIRASYGLAGIVYEVTFRIKPLEIVRFDYDVHDVGALTQDQITQVIASNDAMVCWTIGRKVVIQTRNRATELRHHPRRRSPLRLELPGRVQRTARPSALAGGGDQRAGRHRIGSRARLLPAAERDRRLHALRSRQDDQLLEDAAVGPICVHVLGVSEKRVGAEPERLRRRSRRRTSSSTASGATCRSVPISSGRTAARCCPTPTTATSSRSIRFTRPANIDRAAWAAFLREFNEWSRCARRPAAAEPEPLRQEGSTWSRPTATAGRRCATGCARSIPTGGC